MNEGAAGAAHRAREAAPPAAEPVPDAAGLPLVALLGRPNSGKSSLYNAVAGARAHVGNFPGITVDILVQEVLLPKGGRVELADLPGLYSIEAVVDPATDEGVARTFLAQALSGARPVVLVQVVDSTQLALGLRLTREALAWASGKVRVLVVCTQDDVLRDHGRTLDVAALEARLDAPVLAVSARDQGTRSRVLAAVEKVLAAPLAVRSAPSWDPLAVAHAVTLDRAGGDHGAQRRRERTARLDAWLLHPLLGPLLFVGVMSLVFAGIFLVADPVTALIGAAVSLARGRLTQWLGDGLLASFLGDGLLSGAGTVLAFTPQVVILTMAMELMEASGYLTRGAFLLDRLLRLLGLTGRSFVPLLMAHACAVPAITATRVIRDPRERMTTLLVLPLMTCSARIPTYALLISAFFSGYGVIVRALLFVALYFVGILGGLVASLVLRRTATRGRALPLVLEMPQYRAPQASVVLGKGWLATKGFLRDVGTTILGVAAILWVLLTVPAPWAHAGPEAASAHELPQTTSTRKADALEASVAASVGRALEPFTRPIGFDWRINVGLIGSFGAREVMVGTLGVIFGLEDEAGGDDPAPLAQRLREARTPEGGKAYSARTALSLLAFFVFACQCMSTVAAIRRETRSWRWPAFVVGYTYVVAYAAAFATYQVAGVFLTS